MIFPIGDDQVYGGYKPFFSYLLILINIVVFIYELTLNTSEFGSFIYTYGAIPSDINHGRGVLTLLTAMFLHGGWFHLIGNMVFLWVFADNIEAVVGNFRFLAFYLGGGVVASLFHMAFYPDSVIPMVGASGAISAVLGGYFVLFPRAQIKLIFILLFRVFYLSAYLFLGIWIIQQLFYGFTSLGPSSANEPGVAWWAHIGGFLFGIVGGLLLRRYISVMPLTRYS